MFLSCHVCISEWIYTLYLPEYQGTPCLKQAWYLKFKWVHLWTKWSWVRVQLQSFNTAVTCFRRIIDFYSYQVKFFYQIFFYQILDLMLPDKYFEQQNFMLLKHGKTMFDFMPWKVLFFITQFCCGETGKVSGALFRLSSILCSDWCH